jgi:hypothetical protein
MRDLLGLPGAQGRTRARARALQAGAWVLYVQETTADGVAALEESIALARELGDRATLARSLAILGVTFGLNTAEPERAVPSLEEALQLAWPLEDTWSIGFSLFIFGRMALGRGDVPLAQRLCCSSALRSSRLAAPRSWFRVAGGAPRGGGCRSGSARA